VDPITGKENSVILHNPQRLNQYAYGLNNPYRYVDADGRWSAAVHNIMIDQAFSSANCKLNNNIRDYLKAASYQADLDQSVAGAHKHAMSMPGQTPSDAHTEMMTFVNGQINKYRALKKNGKIKEAYTELGLAFHALMDSTSPSHEGFQVWSGLETSDADLFAAAKVAEGLVHSYRETDEVFRSNPTYLNNAVNLIRSYYDYANRP
jgi:hypothetical protein